MHDVCVGHGWCGGIVDGMPSRVDDFIPETGPVSSDQFVDWLFAAEGDGPLTEAADRVREKYRPALKTLFAQHMEADTVDASLLKWDL
jgi:hypothetical protein